MHITFCATCTRDNNHFLHAIETLQHDYSDELCIIELNCMAACDASPTILLEDDYYPAITPHELCQHVKDHITVWRDYEQELTAPG